jgi:3-phenylpropionate/cinnamic acid dioxygenase small subunit
MNDMPTDNELKREVAELIYWEATLLDRRRWDDWIDLFTEDAVFWAPTWANEEEVTNDPETQLNLIYLRGRGGLEDRIFRLESRDSYASVPLERTVHVIGNILIDNIDGDDITAFANGLIHIYGKKGGRTRASLYDYTIRRIDGNLKITQKKITLIDDQLEGPVDIYHL